MNDIGRWTRVITAEVVKGFCVNFEVGVNRLSWQKCCGVCHDEDSEVKKEVSVRGTGEAKIGFRLI